MSFNGVCAVDEYWIISPAYAVYSDFFGKLYKVLHYLFFGRNIRFDVPAVGSYRYEPILMIWFQLFKMLQHRFGIFRAEGNTVHNIGIQLIACYPVRAVRIPHQHIACPYPVHKPLGIKCRDIRPHTCVDYHCPHRPFFLFYHIQPVSTRLVP